MKIRIRSLIPVCMALAVHTASAQVQPVDYVDMFMGNRGESNCVIGPQLPHGSVNPSPQTPGGGNDGYDPSQPIRGFGQLHVSGTGWGRYGQILLSPQVGFSADEQGHDSPKSGESALPYYYAVTLDRYGIRTELAPTHNAAIYRFSFPAAEDANILLDIAHNIPQHIKPEIGGRFLGGAISYDPETGIIGGWGSYRGGFGSGAPYKVYFAAALDRAPRSVAVTDDGDGKLYARIALPPFDAPGTVLLKIAVSLRSESNARKFLAEQIPGHDFEKVKAAARETWNRRLNSIQIDTESETAKKIFYTALYHSFLMARDRTGDNPHTDSDTPHMDDHYCIWDTWRTKYPLMTLLNESYVARSINSFIERFERTGACQPTYTSSLEWEAKQGGDDVDNVIVDAWLKGVEGVDWTRAYRIVRFHALNTRSHEYLRLGWQPETGSPMSCSAALEYAYNDYCASLMAEGMGDHETARMLSQRSCSWEKLFDTSLESDGFKGFVAPRKEDGQWISIDPKKTYGSWVEYFYEGNSWVYSLFAPHQFDRLAELCGGPRRTVERLEHGFSRKLIDLNNEPGFLAPYIFTHCSRADLTSKYVAQIRDTQFSLERGYPGNEDSGAMGAWYVFTSVGLFPNAGQDLYYLVSPQFERSVLTTERGARIVIEAKGLSRENRYIGSVTLNGRSLGRAWLRHGEIADGAHIVLTMSSVPNPFESGVKPEGGKTVIVQLSDPQFGYWSDNREMTREIEACGEAVRRINRLKPDLVFFACLDDMLPTLAPLWLFNLLLPYQWSGLLVQSALPPYHRGMPDTRPFLRSKNCVGVGILNEYSAKDLETFQRHILLFPDFADLSAPATNYPLLRKLKEKARGRKVISLLGSINFRKGIKLLLESIPLLPKDEYFFLIAGKSSLTAQQENDLRAFGESRNNCLFSLEKIPDESCFNALIAESDLIFAAYKQFTGSSNLLTKAAAFRKPVIVSRGLCMGRRVEQYGTGQTTGEDNAGECSAAIRSLCTETRMDIQAFARYAHEHEVEKLITCFNQISKHIQ